MLYCLCPQLLVGIPSIMSSWLIRCHLVLSYYKVLFYIFRFISSPHPTYGIPRHIYDRARPSSSLEKGPNGYIPMHLILLISLVSVRLPGNIPILSWLHAYSRTTGRQQASHACSGKENNIYQWQWDPSHPSLLLLLNNI